MRLDHLLSKEKRSEKNKILRLVQGKTLFNFEDTEKYPLKKWGYSSAGRAPALQAGGQEFDPPYLHHKEEIVIKDSE